MLSGALKRILQRQPVDDRGDHAHVVGLRLIHTATTALGAAPEVAATHNNGNVDVEFFAGVTQFARQLRQHIVV